MAMHCACVHERPRLFQCSHSHVQGLLGLGGLLLGAVAHQGVALRQVQVECYEGAVLHAQRPQSGAVDLRRGGSSVVWWLAFFSVHYFINSQVVTKRAGTLSVSNCILKHLQWLFECASSAQAH